MKLLLAALFACLALASAQMPRSDGRPGCRIRYEFDHRWRNNFYTDRYWECTRWGEPAVARWCPDGTRYLDTWQTCVPAHLWENTPYTYPPTSAYEPATNQCEEMFIPDPECPPVGPNVSTTAPPPFPTGGPGVDTTAGPVTTADPGWSTTPSTTTTEIIYTSLPEETTTTLLTTTMAGNTVDPEIQH